MEIEQSMRRAIELSYAVLGSTSPNPPVGAVALDANGAPVGEGATSPPGGLHAERHALGQAHGRAHTLVTTLEPCNHTGRTGPCSEALIEAGIKRVVVAVAEPTGLAGGGNARLREAGIEVVEHVLEREAEQGPLAGWLHRQRTGRPQVIWKYAATLDGRSAAADGTSQWITGPQAREDVQHLRAEVDAIVVGIGTVLQDDPLLTARVPHATQPLRVVVDSRGRAPRTAKVFGPEAETLHVTAEPGLQVDLVQLLKELDTRGVTRVLVEGGPTLAASFWKAGLIDEVVAYVAPALLGAGPLAVGDLGLGTISEAARLHLIDVTRFGEDVRLRMRRI